MKRLISRSGFTIVELLIVLAVVGVIAVATLPFISGKQSSTQYTVGINQIQTQISSVINNISTGNIPINGSYTCATQSNGSSLKITGNSGSNTGACQFLGEAIYFKKNSMQIIPIAGLRAAADGNLIQNISDSKPCPMLNGGVDKCSSFDGSTSYTYTNGIVLSKYGETTIDSNITDANYGEMFVVLSSSTLTSSAQQNGSISIDTVDLQTFNPGTNNITIFSKISGIGTTSLNNQVTLCFDNFATNQHGNITLSVNGSPAEVSLTNVQGAC